MRVLFISHELTAGNIAYLLKQEGCDVKLFIEKKELRPNFQNLVIKTDNWKKELNWVGKKGLIVFDDVGYGKIQEKLRKQGFSVFGGSVLGDRLEEDRPWSQKIFKEFGLNTLPTINFTKIDYAISFLNKNAGPWVLKQNGHAQKNINYVGHFKDNRDVISLLKYYKNNYGKRLGEITLQKRVYGVEIGIGRYFNGADWVGPIEFNVEHKKLFPGEMGPTTSEMGTIAWYDNNENNILFQETLSKLKSFLKQIDFRGDFDIGCIVNKEGIFPLEATPRLGTPIVHLQSELHLSPWHKLLKAIADKKEFKLKWKKGVGIVILLCVSPFPYIINTKEISPVGLELYLNPNTLKKERRHIHFEGISRRKRKNGKEEYYVSDHQGYILCVTALGKNISEGRNRVKRICKKIFVSKMFYRNDIGVKFEKEELNMLKKWGYL